MPTKNPRVSVVLEKPLYQSIKEIAKRDGLTLSVKLRDIAREAIEIDEDALLLAWAKAREKTFKRSKALTIEQAFSE